MKQIFLTFVDYLDDLRSKYFLRVIPINFNYFKRNRCRYDIMGLTGLYYNNVIILCQMAATANIIYYIQLYARYLEYRLGNTLAALLCLDHYIGLN